MARAKLCALQQARRFDLRTGRLERAVRRHLLRIRREIDRLLRTRGLRLKGYEVRGWRALRAKEFARGTDDPVRALAGEHRKAPDDLCRH